MLNINNFLNLRQNLKMKTPTIRFSHISLFQHFINWLESEGIALFEEYLIANASLDYVDSLNYSDEEDNTFKFELIEE